MGDELDLSAATTYDDYTLTPGDLAESSPTPPSNKWWQDIVSGAAGATVSVIAARQANQRNANSNPPPGGGGPNPQAGTLGGAGAKVGAVLSKNVFVVLGVVGLALAAAFVMWKAKR